MGGLLTTSPRTRIELKMNGDKEVSGEVKQNGHARMKHTDVTLGRETAQEVRG